LNYFDLCGSLIHYNSTARCAQDAKYAKKDIVTKKTLSVLRAFAVPWLLKILKILAIKAVKAPTLYIKSDREYTSKERNFSISLGRVMVSLFLPLSHETSTSFLTDTSIR